MRFSELPAAPHQVFDVHNDLGIVVAHPSGVGIDYFLDSGIFFAYLQRFIDLLLILRKDKTCLSMLNDILDLIRC